MKIIKKAKTGYDFVGIGSMITQAPMAITCAASVENGYQRTKLPSTIFDLEQPLICFNQTTYNLRMDIVIIKKGVNIGNRK
jgi:hypothetical protein